METTDITCTTYVNAMLMKRGLWLVSMLPPDCKSSGKSSISLTKPTLLLFFNCHFLLRIHTHIHVHTVCTHTYVLLHTYTFRQHCRSGKLNKNPMAWKQRECINYNDQNLSLWLLPVMKGEDSDVLNVHQLKKKKTVMC